MRKNRQCICCSTEYSYCPDCNGVDRLKESWYSEFCSSDCKDLWLTATKFNMQLLSKNEAMEIISGLNIKDMADYVDCVKRDLEVIFAEDKPLVQAEEHKKRGKKPEEHAVVKENE